MSWNITKVTYNPETNEILETTYSTHESYEAADLIFREQASKKEPVYLCFELEDQKKVLSKSIAYFNECLKVA